MPRRPSSAPANVLWIYLFQHFVTYHKFAQKKYSLLDVHKWMEKDMDRGSDIRDSYTDSTNLLRIKLLGKENSDNYLKLLYLQMADAFLYMDTLEN